MAWTFTVSSRLSAPCAAVWAAVTSPEGINSELSPFLAMTWPKDAPPISIDALPLGRPLFRSWILLFGLLPIDYDDILLEDVEEGRGFRERSAMLTQRSWCHERALAPEVDGACRITDRITFVPRAATIVIAPIYWLLSRGVFAWRHRRLRARFGSA